MSRQFTDREWLDFFVDHWETPLDQTVRKILTITLMSHFSASASGKFDPEWLEILLNESVSQSEGVRQLYNQLDDEIRWKPRV